MRRMILAALAALGLFTIAHAGQFTITPNTTTAVLAPVTTYPQSLPPYSNLTAYASGTLVRYGQMAYYTYAGGTSGTNGLATGADVVTDNTVVWLKSPSQERDAIALQFVSGLGSAVVNTEGSPLMYMTVPGTFASITSPSCYQGAVTVSCVGTTIVFNARSWSVPHSGR